MLSSTRCNNKPEEGSNSYQKLAVEEILCPITGHLPVDPVIAEDGRIYERRKIEKHIEINGSAMKSPFTKKPMGPQLFPAVQIRKIIEALVKSGVVDSEKVQWWKERTRTREDVDTMRQKAEGGDVSAMYTLGRWYGKGMKDLETDQSQAYHWYERASEFGHAGAMAYTGVRLVLGQGVEKNTVYGMHLVSMAAEKGSDFAVCFLAACFKKGIFGLPRDTRRATSLFQKVLNGRCKFKHLSEQDREEAIVWLREMERK